MPIIYTSSENMFDINQLQSQLICVYILYFCCLCLTICCYLKLRSEVTVNILHITGNKALTVITYPGCFPAVFFVGYQAAGL